MGKRLRASLVVWILFAYFGAIAGHIAWQTAYDSAKKRETRGFFLQHALRVGKPLLREGRTRELNAYLREAVEMGLIDYYELEQPGKALEKGGAGPESAPTLAEPVSHVGGWIWGKLEAEDTTLRIASGVGWRARLHAAWAAKTEGLPGDLAFLLLASVCLFFFRRKSARQAERGPNAVSAFIAEPRPSPRQERALEAPAPSVAAPAALAAPERFEGVFGRAALLLPAGEAEALPRLEAFLADGAAAVARYRGEWLSASGHELHFCFHGASAQTSARLALAAARDLGELAEAQGFRVVVALGFGPLRAGNVQGSRAVFGGPVEESAALLRGSLQQQKPGLRVTKAFESIAGKENSDAVPEVLEECKRGRVSGLAFHRGDSAIAETLRSLASGEWERESFVATVSELRGVQCRRCGPELLEAFRALLGAELARKDSYRLSSALALAPHLLNRAVIDAPLEKMFLEAVKVKDRRVRANAVDLFTKFFPEREIPELRPLLRDEDNRVSANALIKAACERFDEKVIARIEDRVRGGSVAHVASALHALGEIAAYYRRTDPLFLASKIAFLRLFDGVTDWAMHPNPMIRRQALIAAHKLGSPAVDEKLQALFQQTSDPELLSLFLSVYGWSKGEARAA